MTLSDSTYRRGLVWAFLGVCLLLGTVAVLACVIPVRRVTRAGAAGLLRSE